MRVTDDPVMDAVLREAATLLAPETLDYGGLTIFTTIDPQLQRLAQSAADRRLTEIEEQKGYPHPKKRDFVPGTNADGTEKPTNYLQTAVRARGQPERRNPRLGRGAAITSRASIAVPCSPGARSARPSSPSFMPLLSSKGLYPGSLVDDSKSRPVSSAICRRNGLRRIRMGNTAARSRRPSVCSNRATR
jgi:penicillin-binding protein 1A